MRSRFELEVRKIGVVKVLYWNSIFLLSGYCEVFRFFFYYSCFKFFDKFFVLILRFLDLIFLVKVFDWLFLDYVIFRYLLGDEERKYYFYLVFRVGSMVEFF